MNSTDLAMDRWYEGKADRHARFANAISEGLNLQDNGPCKHKWQMVSNITIKCQFCAKLKQIDF